MSAQALQAEVTDENHESGPKPPKCHSLSTLILKVVIGRHCSRYMEPETSNRCFQHSSRSLRHSPSDSIAHSKS